jgi:hypothetical protein
MKEEEGHEEMNDGRKGGHVNYLLIFRLYATIFPMM